MLQDSKVRKQCSAIKLLRTHKVVKSLLFANKSKGKIVRLLKRRSLGEWQDAQEPRGRVRKKEGMEEKKDQRPRPPNDS